MSRAIRRGSPKKPARHTRAGGRPLLGASKRAASLSRGARTERELRDQKESNRPVARGPRKPTEKKLTRSSPVPNTELYPMRINKYLAQKGIATRRDADMLIAKRVVLINGEVAQIGDKVKETDTVELRKHVRPVTYAYIAYNKPVGMDTHREDTGAENILDSLPSDLRRMKLFPVGRLDKGSRGLIILTNDGRITDRLLNPDYTHEKTYEVRTKLPLRESFKENMERGVAIEGYVTRPAIVKILGENRFRITLTEGKSHQIRRMVVALHNEVADLKRTRIMNIELGTLATAGWRPIEGAELSEFMHSLGLA